MTPFEVGKSDGDDDDDDGALCSGYSTCVLYVCLYFYKWMALCVCGVHACEYINVYVGNMTGVTIIGVYNLTPSLNVMEI